MKKGLGISKVLDPFFLVLDETAQKTVLVPLPDICTVAALAGVDFVQNHWHDRTCRLRVPHITPHADSAGRLSPPHAALNAKVISSECLLNRLDAGPGCTRLTHTTRAEVGAPRSARAAKILHSEHIVPRPHRRHDFSAWFV